MSNMFMGKAYISGYISRRRPLGSSRVLYSYRIRLIGEPGNHFPHTEQTTVTKAKAWARELIERYNRQKEHEYEASRI